MVRPTHCPYEACPGYRPGEPFDWIRRGTYRRKCDGRQVQRYECLECGRTFSQQTFRVDVIPDTTNSAPFLADIPPLTTTVDTAITYQLEAIDVEGNAALYLDQETMAANGLPVPVVAPADLVSSVDFTTGLLTVTPTNGLLGEHRVSVATGVHTGAVDYQAVQVIINPAAP